MVGVLDARVTTAGLVLTIMITCFQWNIWGTLLPALLAEGIFTVDQSARMFAFGYITYFMGKLGLGKSADILQGRKSLILIAFLLSGALLGPAVVGSSGMLLYFFFVLGSITSPGTWPGLAKTIPRWWEPETHSVIWGLLSMAVNIGGLFVGFLLSFVLHFLDWRSCFLASAGISLFCAIIIMGTLYDKPEDVPRCLISCSEPRGNSDYSGWESEDKIPLGEVNVEDEKSIVSITDPSHPLDSKSRKEVLIYFLTSAKLWTMTIATLAVTSVGAFHLSFTTLYISRQLHVSDASAAFTSTSVRLGMLLGTLFGTIFYGKLGPLAEILTNAIFLSISLFSTFLLWYLDSDSHVCIYILLALMSMGMSIVWYFPVNLFAIKFGGPTQSILFFPPPTPHSDQDPTPSSCLQPPACSLRVDLLEASSVCLCPLTNNLGGIVSGLIDGISNIGSVGVTLLIGSYVAVDRWDVVWFILFALLLLCLVFILIFLFLEHREYLRKYGASNPK